MLQGMDVAPPSYASGVSAVPLLGETIGENLERAAARYADREALVDVATGRRWTYTELDTEIGAILVNVNPAYRDSDDRAMLAEIGFEQTVFIGEPGWDELVAAGRRADPARLRERTTTLTFDYPRPPVQVKLFASVGEPWPLNVATSGYWHTGRVSTTLPAASVSWPVSSSGASPRSTHRTTAPSGSVGAAPVPPPQWPTPGATKKRANVRVCRAPMEASIFW